MSSPFKRAQKRAVKLRAAIDGPSGAGKTLSALRIARGLVGPEGTIAVIDTEHGTAEKFYARMVEFDHAPLVKYQPRDYIDLMKQAEYADVLVIDSLSHAWSEGVLGMVDAKGGQFDAWRHVTPHHNALVTALLTFPGHLIVTMRSKMSYEVSKDEKTGKTRVEKLGLKPVQREGMEYELDLVMDMDMRHALTVGKSRITELADRTVLMPGEEFGAEIAALVSDGLPEPVDTLALARDLSAIAGDNEALKAALAEAKITRDDLADEVKLGVAREIAEKVKLRSRFVPPADEPPADEPEFINEKQRKRLFAIAKENGVSDAWVKAVVLDLTGQDSRSKIPVDKYEAIIDAIQAGPQAEHVAAGGEPLFPAEEMGGEVERPDPLAIARARWKILTDEDGLAQTKDAVQERVGDKPERLADDEHFARVAFMLGADFGAFISPKSEGPDEVVVESDEAVADALWEETGDRKGAHKDPAA